MKIKISGIFLVVSLFVFAQERDVEYIQNHAWLAVQEMEMYKIPASITLSQGILETGGGQSRLAEKANNHFGIKCKKEWTGETITHDDDALGECFRKYPSVQDSYRDHSKFLAERPYYKKLFDLDITDYKGWAHGLKKSGYATNPRYAYILIDRIEKYNLNQFDTIKKDGVYDRLVALYGPVDRAKVDPTFDEEIIVVVEEPEEVIQNESKDETKTMEVPKREENPRVRVKRHPIGREYVVVKKGETLGQLSKMYDVSVSKLMNYNELENPEDLREGQYLFFGKKRSRGSKRFYTVQKGDNMYLIAQKAGIKLKKLYRRNRMEVGEQPKVGQQMYLRGRKRRK